MPKNAAEAAIWYWRAAEQGFDRAQANLASLYLAGEGVPQDYAEAAKWFGAAALQGHTVAQYNLALLFEHGLGVPKDEARALGLYNLAARAGHPQALDRLTRLVAKAPLRETPKSPAPETKAAASQAEPAKPETVARAEADVPVATTREPEPAPAAASAPASAPAPETEPAPATEPKAERPGFFSRLFGAGSEPDTARTPGATVEIGPSEPADGPEREPRPGTDVTVAVLPDVSRTEPPSEVDRPKSAPAPAPESKPETKPESGPESTPQPESESKSEPESKPEPKPEPENTAVAAPAKEPESSGGGFLGVLRAVFPPEARRDERISGPLPPEPAESPKQPASDSKPEPKPADDSGKPEVQPAAAPEPEAKPADAPKVAALSTPAAEPAPAAAPEPATAPEPARPEPQPFDVALAAYHQGDYQQALARWLPLARAGHTRAQYYVGRLYRAGEGVPPDKVRAYLWWTLAARQGDDEAAKAASALAGEMTRGQVMDAEALAEGFRPTE